MFLTKYLLPFVVLCIFRTFEVSACTGCIQLDEYTFDKLINKFGAVLVKFDVAFPYGDEHEAYAKIAKDAKSQDDLLIAEVGIKDYGQKDNEVLGQRYNVKKDDYPVVKLFLKNKKEPITLSEKPLTQDNLQKFLRANAGIHLSGPGCIPKLDTLAIKFLDTHPNKRTKLSDEANIIINGLPEKDKKTGSVYLQIMKKITDKGEDFIKNENDRLLKLLDGKVSEDKKKEISTKLNILKSFSNVNEKANDEL